MSAPPISAMAAEFLADPDSINRRIAAAGILKADLAMASGMYPSNLADVLNGRRPLTGPTAERIAVALDQLARRRLTALAALVQTVPESV